MAIIIIRLDQLELAYTTKTATARDRNGWSSDAHRYIKNTAMVNFIQQNGWLAGKKREGIHLLQHHHGIQVILRWSLVQFVCLPHTPPHPLTHTPRPARSESCLWWPTLHEHPI